MKKILFTLLIVCCVSLCFAGCDGLGENFWLDAQASAQTIFEGENFKDVYNISYGDNLTFIMNTNYGCEYAEIKNVLTPLFTSAVSYAYEHYNDFLQNPANKDSAVFKTQIKNFNKNLREFEQAINEFKEQKDLYLSFITESGENFASSNIERARLLNFKRDYITVIENAFELSESVFNARKTGYYDFSNYLSEDDLLDSNADCSLALNATNLAITKCAIVTVRQYNAKEVATVYEDYYSESQEFYNIVKKFENNEYMLVSDIKTKLKHWQYAYNMFTQEINEFLNVLNKIDLKLLIECENNAELYAKETKNDSDKYYATYYLNFSNKINLIKTFALNFFVLN